ncbi:hypothetical protein SAMN04488128_104244 [Chitinophaga eiseniae]|uniref:SnoaL-like domain-containing protein n=1 Tax=Chitinophaga eiseniae TaxID=634771 RepID=A0A1T4TA35_9BACT|nr:nuclear transport factor 2 family protein [Chitinophaga eiseniae]SKA37247.1 hypothetical protein SAMN04488128_104244 [Chitinophaga eiseniae]
MKDFIKALFRDIIENNNYDETLIHQYFSEDYVQIVDDQTLNFDTFKKHIRNLKEKVRETEVQFAGIASNETSVFTRHYVKSMLKNGEWVKHKVLAEFQIKDGKVVQCDELTMLMEGNKSESNLGSAV